jgi:2',3'-cyclic-nucleotide 2'-phosphodiesterase (5'-nucleotidase family)
MATLKVGQVVKIYAGINKQIVKTGNIVRVSPTGKRLTVITHTGNTTAFYRSTDGSKYVNNPGSGIFGSMLNDYIKIDGELNG